MTLTCGTTFNCFKPSNGCPLSLVAVTRRDSRGLVWRLLAVHTAMSIYDISISSCTRCRTSEFNWSSGSLLNGHLPDYTCTRCLDSDGLRRHRTRFLVTYRIRFMVLPQICMENIYAFTHPECHNQWKKLNRYNHKQRRNTMKFFLAGAPWTNNWIHNLYRKLRRQQYRDQYQNLVGDHIDFYSCICDYLI